MSSFTVVPPIVSNVVGQQLRRDVKYTGPTSYDTGGSGTPQKLSGLGIRFVEHITIEVESLTYLARYVRGSGLIQVFVRATGAEVAGAVDLSAEVFHLAAVGT